FAIFFYNDTHPTDIYTLSLHDALPISRAGRAAVARSEKRRADQGRRRRRDEAGGAGDAAVAGGGRRGGARRRGGGGRAPRHARRSEEHTSELQSRGHLVCRLLLEKKKE